MQQLQEDVCYDSELFTSTQLEGLLCPIGLGVLRNPVFDQCGHVYCFGCINAWLKKSNLCPINKAPILVAQLIKAIPIKNMVDNLELKQCLQMCEWKGKLDQYYGHIEKECPQSLINCKNKECNEKIKRIDLPKHLNTCQYEEIQCEFCDKTFNQKNIEGHKLNCGEKIIECNDCHQKIKTNDDVHAYQCEFRLIQCPIEGCLDLNIRRNQLDEHLKSLEHLILLQNSIKSLKLQIEQQNQVIEQNNQKRYIPYFEGWKLSYQKKIESREWLTISSLEKLPQYFSISFEIMGLQKRPNQWRCSVGICETQISNQHLWYRQKNSFVWILGGFKCSTQAEKYGKEVQDENMKGKIILNRQNELSFEQSGENQGVAFVIDDQLVRNRLYLMTSFINQGKIRLTGIDIL